MDNLKQENPFKKRVHGETKLQKEIENIRKLTKNNDEYTYGYKERLEGLEKGAELQREEITKLIKDNIKRNVPMVGGTPKSNHLYRKGWTNGLRWLEKEIKEIK